MAKIIKVGSQNPTFTSQKTKKASPIHTHRNSNEVTNPFKFTNFEGNTLQFADVFEGFKPNFKASPVNKMRMIASSVTGSMSKMKSTMSESIVNFVHRVRDWASVKRADFLAIPAVKKANEILFTPYHVSDIITGMKEGIISKYDSISHGAIDMGNSVKEKWNGIISQISMYGKSKYATMPVSEIESSWREIIALEGGIA